MRDFLRKPFRWAMIFSVLMVVSFSYVMLDTFVIPKSYQATVTKAATQNDTVTDDQNDAVTDEQSGIVADDQNDTGTDDQSDAVTDTDVASETVADTASEGISSEEAGMKGTAATTSEAVVTDNSYDDGNISITIDTLREYDSDIYVADIVVTDASYLKTALAEGTYGRNIKATTSEIAADNNAILAVNGDFYGFRNYGYVVRNGVLYRDSSGEDDALVIDTQGNFSVINEQEISLDTLDLNTIWQILSFGPALVEEGQIVVSDKDEVGRAMSSNPRTAIGQISPLHYIIIVSDGRTDESAGLSLLQLAKVFEDYGCTTAYNLDGGGSSTMVFNGEVVNVPTDGHGIGEREVSDIVYIGY